MSSERDTYQSSALRDRETRVEREREVRARVVRVLARERGVRVERVERVEREG